ncbi:LutC/YkgG family protein [Candidatus Viridilinea mediisalina]|uniref:Lactate utilization protein n=1 Tax=Candidatus Viridilinea mediisalina TaxID=2024553 RepID=A0A2A6RLS5_9CHLR|nr:lactate utilization protein [Candidatus Viridilinea mediisalina]PDW04012.1 lactate utilization protein [Candidatus Viridilinea mediisalina]
MSREEMLATLRTSLAATGQWLTEEARRVPHVPPSFVMPAEMNLVAQFVAELTKLEARVYRVEQEAEALTTLAHLLQARSAQQIIAWDLDQLDLPGLDALLVEHEVVLLDPWVRDEGRKERLQALEPAPVCLSAVDCAIAESGTLVVRHGPGRPRIASLLAPTHIALVRAEQIVRGLGDALALLRERHGTQLFDQTSNLTLISGPSRTADIELTLSLGIHGPPELHVILF